MKKNELKNSKALWFSYKTLINLAGGLSHFKVFFEAEEEHKPQTSKDLDSEIGRCWHFFSDFPKCVSWGTWCQQLRHSTFVFYVCSKNLFHDILGGHWLVKNQNMFKNSECWGNQIRWCHWLGSFGYFFGLPRLTVPPRSIEFHKRPELGRHLSVYKTGRVEFWSFVITWQWKAILIGKCSFVLVTGEISIFWKAISHGKLCDRNDSGQSFHQEAVSLAERWSSRHSSLWKRKSKGSLPVVGISRIRRLEASVFSTEGDACGSVCPWIPGLSTCYWSQVASLSSSRLSFGFAGQSQQSNPWSPAQWHSESFLQENLLFRSRGFESASVNFIKKVGNAVDNSLLSLLVLFCQCTSALFVVSFLLLTLHH